MPSAENTAFLGSGLKWPIQVNAFGSVAYVVGTDLVKQSIAMYLEFSLNDLFFLRDCGSRLKELQFDPNDTILEGVLEGYVKDCLDNWEQRIKFMHCSFSYPSVEVINIRIFYKVLGSNEVDSFIYPFYVALKF